MTLALRIRRARKFCMQLWEINPRTACQEAELVWWEDRLRFLEESRPM